MHLHIDESAARFQRLHTTLANPMAEIYLLFFQSALQNFVHFNKFLQSEYPLLPILCTQMESFLTKLASKFLPVTAIKAAKKNICTLEYNEKDQQLSGIIKFCIIMHNLNNVMSLHV